MFTLHKVLVFLVVIVAPLSLMANGSTREIIVNNVDGPLMRIIVETPDPLVVYPVFAVPYGKKYRVRNVMCVEDDGQGLYNLVMNAWNNMGGGNGHPGLPWWVLENSTGESVRMTNESVYGADYYSGSIAAKRGYSFDEGESLSIDMSTLDGYPFAPKYFILIVEEF
jgi:hypothetical protein